MFPASTVPRSAEDPLDFVTVTSIAHSPFSEQVTVVKRMEPFILVPSGALVPLLTIVWHRR